MEANTSELFDKAVRNAFMRSYKGWIEICKPQRVKNGGCSECALDPYHWTGICGAFQDIGRNLEKSVRSKVHKLNTEKSIRDRDISEFTELMIKYACPGPDLFQASGD